MNYDWQMELKARGRPAAMFLPPSLVEEAAWDILLALHSDENSRLSLDKLACLVSVQPQVFAEWLALLEQRQLVVSKKHGFTQEIRAVLTHAGRRMLDRYLSVASDLQIGANH